jgi:hypothetical protein
MVGKISGAAIDAVDANAIAVAIGTDQAHFQMWLGSLPDGCFGSRGHHFIR